MEETFVNRLNHQFRSARGKIAGRLLVVGQLGRSCHASALDIIRTRPGDSLFEVYLGAWLTFDARFNVPRIGRIKVAHGLDASDTAIATIYGEAPLKGFDVWAYQVDPKQVSVGDLVDLSKRLDGTEQVRH